MDGNQTTKVVEALLSTHGPWLTLEEVAAMKPIYSIEKSLTIYALQKGDVTFLAYVCGDNVKTAVKRW